MRSSRPILAAILSLLLVSPAGAAEQEPAFSKAVKAYNARNLEASFRYAKDAVAEQPGSPDVYLLLGQLYYLRQDLRKAKENWERARKLAPERKDIAELLEKLERESGVEKNLAKTDTYPFVVRFAEAEVPVDLSVLREILRDAHRQIGQQLNYFPDHTIPVLLYPDADFQKVKSLSHQVGGLYDGKIRLPLTDRMDGGRLQQVLWHEYTHALIHDLSHGRCPMWLNEGLASSQESRVASLDVRLVRQALQEGKVPSWDLLWSQSGYEPSTLQLYYETSYLIVQYLVKRWSWLEMTQLLNRLGEGAPIKEALRAQYRTDPDGIEREWRAWLKRQ